MKNKLELEELEKELNSNQIFTEEAYNVLYKWYMEECVNMPENIRAIFKILFLHLKASLKVKNNIDSLLYTFRKFLGVLPKSERNNLGAKKKNNSKKQSESEKKEAALKRAADKKKNKENVDNILE